MSAEALALRYLGPAARALHATPIFREDQSIAEAIVDRVGNDAVPLRVEQRAKNNGNWKSYSSHARCRKTNGDEDAEVAPEQFVSIRGEYQGTNVRFASSRQPSRRKSLKKAERLSGIGSKVTHRINAVQRHNQNLRIRLAIKGAAGKPEWLLSDGHDKLDHRTAIRQLRQNGILTGDWLARNGSH